MEPGWRVLSGWPTADSASLPVQRNSQADGLGGKIDLRYQRHSHIDIVARKPSPNHTGDYPSRLIFQSNPASSNSHVGNNIVLLYLSAEPQQNLMKRSSQESFFDSSFSAWGMEHHMAPVLHRLPRHRSCGTDVPANQLYPWKKHQSILDREPQISKKTKNKYSGHSIVLLIYSMISPLYHHQIIISHVTPHLFPLKALGFRLPSSLLGAGLLPMALHGAWDMGGMLDDAGVEHELPIPKVPWILCNCIYIYIYMRVCVCVRVIFHYYYY